MKNYVQVPFPPEDASLAMLLSFRLAAGDEKLRTILNELAAGQTPLTRQPQKVEKISRVEKVPAVEMALRAETPTKVEIDSSSDQAPEVPRAPTQAHEPSMSEHIYDIAYRTLKFSNPGRRNLILRLAQNTAEQRELLDAFDAAREPGKKPATSRELAGLLSGFVRRVKKETEEKGLPEPSPRDIFGWENHNNGDWVYKMKEPYSTAFKQAGERFEYFVLSSSESEG